jgi:hypothetical protein
MQVVSEKLNTQVSQLLNAVLCPTVSYRTEDNSLVLVRKLFGKRRWD